MKQYEVWWALLPLPAGRRPVLLLSRTSAYEYLNKVTVAEITTTIRGIGAEVTLSRQEGMARMSVANLDNIRTVPIRSLVEKIGALSAGRHHVVKRALGHAFEWDELLQAKPAKLE
ncbi:MAG: type II toxin-antitoxin system PemK/MazF family toxin [Acidobacteria bacterium]|nr:type II toxin-antitoxin system PemK/MazF family toxin [Acidobacteriota bacterium]